MLALGTKCDHITISPLHYMFLKKIKKTLILMDLSAHWNIFQKMQLLYSTSRDSGDGAIPPFLNSEGAGPCCRPPPPPVATPLIWGETTDLHGLALKTCSFILTKFFWTKEVKAIIQMPSCFCRSNALSHVFLYPERSRSKFHLTSRHIKARCWLKANLQINRCGFTRWAQ